jgi:hypothetical protein
LEFLEETAVLLVADDGPTAGLDSFGVQVRLGGLSSTSSHAST